MKRSYSLMPQATISRTAASAAIGTSASHFPATRMKMSRNREWKIPAIGDLAPARMLVAVRAIAPVAGSPPKAENMLAIPMPTSSCPERCRRPVIPSATVADSNASMPARKAMTKALGITSRASPSDMCGRCGMGKPPGIEGNRSPTVTTGRSNTAAAAAAPTMAIR